MGKTDIKQQTRSVSKDCNEYKYLWENISLIIYTFCLQVTVLSSLCIKSPKNITIWGPNSLVLI